MADARLTESAFDRALRLFHAPPFDRWAALAAFQEALVADSTTEDERARATIYVTAYNIDPCFTTMAFPKFTRVHEPRELPENVKKWVAAMSQRCVGKVEEWWDAIAAACPPAPHGLDGPAIIAFELHTCSKRDCWDKVYISAAVARNLPAAVLCMGRLQSHISSYDSQREAVRLLSAAVNMGHPGAEIELGYLENIYEVSEGMRRRLAWYRRAARRGDAEAMWLLAEANANKRAAAAFRWYLRCAERGHGPSQEMVGLRYLTGNGVARDGTAAAQWLERAADNGRAECLAVLAAMFFSGRGVDADSARAMVYYERVVALPQSAFVKVHRNSWDPVVLHPALPPTSRVLGMHLVAAKAGVVRAMYVVGLCLGEGHLIKRNLKASDDWLSRAAAAGSSDALAALGNAAALQNDLKAAAALYWRAHEAGSAEGSFFAGVCYERGYGIASDGDVAVTCYRAAAERGDDRGAFNYAAAQLAGWHTAQDTVAARRAFIACAERYKGKTRAAKFAAALLVGSDSGGAPGDPSAAISILMDRVGGSHAF